MFRGFERWCRLSSGGYATVNDVNSVPPQLANKMESFWVAETLKYFYLLFEDDPAVMDLSEWVFNTEAHPIPIWGTPHDQRAMERTKQRRLAARLRAKRRAAEQAALAEQEAMQLRAAPRGGQPGQPNKPQDREGYGLAGMQL